MKMFVGIVMALFICLTFRGYTQKVKPDIFDVTLIVECENLNMNKAIRKIAKHELGKLSDVSLDKIDIIPNIHLGQNPGQFIISIIVLDNNCQTCDKIAIASSFLSRGDSIPEFMIDPKHIKAYNSWKKLNTSYNTHKGPIGYCSKYGVEGYIKGIINYFKHFIEFEKQVKWLDQFPGIKKY